MHAAQCEDEIRGCRAELEQLLGAPVQHFCYPYGEYTPTHIQQLQQSGYLSATTTQPGRAYAASSWWELRRVSVVRRTSRWGLLLKVLTGFKDRQA
jgi:peptidoglycan/xylan/chitin deacetylase (PgdA/CDA1 family)